MTVSRQLAIFAVQFACGLVVAFVFHMSTFAGKKSKFAGVLCEVVASICSLAFVWWVNLVCNQGQFKVFYVLSVFVAMATYYTICKEILDKTILSLYNFFTNKR